MSHRQRRPLPRILRRGPIVLCTFIILAPAPGCGGEPSANQAPGEGQPAAHAPAGPAPNAAGPAGSGRGGLDLAPCTSDPTGDLCGTLDVFENREAASGRTIPLNVRVVPASREPRVPDPVFVLAGGPGQAATRLAGWIRRQWIRDPRRDLVLVDQRGTGESNGLPCDLMEGHDDPIAAMDAIFEEPAVIEGCRTRLEEKADLRFYTTPLAMDDLDEVRRALGYDRINVVGGSYGSRAGLIYLRRHGENVRAAVLWGPAPMANTLPLYHSRSSQRALDLLLDQCAADQRCGGAYPDLRRELETILARLEEAPAKVPSKETSPGTVILSRDGFAEALRIQMYTTRGGREVPRLLHAAFQGDYAPFVRTATAGIGGILSQIDLGMLLSVICTEDVPRIDPKAIPGLTEGTFLGGRRIRTQLEICRRWPGGDLPDGFGEPVRSDRPVLVISGELDPVTPPEWGEEMVRHLSRGRHVVVPRAHDVQSSCVEKIASAWLFEDPGGPVDTSCVEEMSLPPFGVDG